MKKLIIVLLIAISVVVVLHAQTGTRKYEYVIVNELGFIDYGNHKTEKFKDIKGKDYSMPDILNYMDEQGYELINSFASPVERYIFRREVKK